MAFEYRMSETGRAYHESDKLVKIALGPFGSGKSCFCSVDALTNACAQNVASDGVRYCRIGVIRSTYPELSSMTRKSLMEILPDSCGTITSAGAPLKGFYLIPLPDGTKLNLELELWALQSPEDAEKIKSANWTFCFINEATGICSEIFNMALTRIGRYPSMSLGGMRWAGILMDSNMPPAQHWLDKLIKDLPDNYALFKQPPAAFEYEDEHGKPYFETNPNAENLRNLGAPQEGDPVEFDTEEDFEQYLIKKGMRYYRDQIDSLLRSGRIDVIRNQYCLKDVPIINGKPVYSGFSYARHVAHQEIKPIQFLDILLGIDQSGHHPAAVVAQNQHGKWCILDELYASGEGFENFVYGMLIPLLRGKYATNPIAAAIDPSNRRDDWQAVTPRERLEEAGIPAVTEITNSPKSRIQMVEHLLNLEVGGLLISPTCENIIRGFVSEYRYRKLQSSGSIGVAYAPIPEKNDSSHYHDALQYLALLIHKGITTSPHESIVEFAQELSRKRQLLRQVM